MQQKQGVGYMKEQSVVIYAFSAKSIETVLDSGVMKNVNVVGVRTDEVVMGAPAIRGIPIIREFDNESLVVLLNEMTASLNWDSSFSRFFCAFFFG